MSISSIASTPNYFNINATSRSQATANKTAAPTSTIPTSPAATSNTQIQSTDNLSLAERFGSDGTGIHTEIKVNGKTIGVMFNSGTSSIDHEYAPLIEKFGWGADDEGGNSGPDRAKLRASQMLSAIKEAGLQSNPSISEAFQLLLKDAHSEAMLASTAMTEIEWGQWLATGKSEPGRQLNRSA